MPEKGKAFAPAAEATFLQKRTGLPLRSEVLKEAILGRHAFIVSLTHEAWIMLAHLAGNASEPKYYQRRPAATRRLLRSLVEEAAKKGEFDMLHRMYASGLLSLNLSREFCYSANRASAYRALLEENGGQEPTLETYHENCLDALWPRKGTNASMASRKPKAEGRMPKAAPIEEKGRADAHEGRISKAAAPIQEKKRKVDGSMGKEKLGKEDGKTERSAKPDPKNEFIAALLEEAPDAEDVLTDFDLIVDPGAANDDSEDNRPMAGKRGAGGQEQDGKIINVHRMEELKMGEWSPESEIEPGEYSKAVISCLVYCSRELADISELANVIVKIKAGKHETTYKTDAAKAMAAWLPEHAITLDIAKRGGEYAAPHSRPEKIEQHDLPDIIRDIIASV
jgi:hypothetical protein